MESLLFEEAHLDVETDSFNALMHLCASLPISSIKHIPRSCRPLLAQTLAREFRYAHQKGLWGFARVHIFAKAVLRLPPRGRKKKRLLMHTLLTQRLTLWPH